MTKAHYKMKLNGKKTSENMKIKVIILEIDRYIVFPIFFPIFKRFTIIGYRICNIGFIDKCRHLVVVLRIARGIAIAARLRGDETTTTVSRICCS